MNRISCWLPAVVLLLGCGSAGDGEPEATGSLSLALETNGVTLNTVTYTITGADFSRTSVVDVTKSTRISALIGGLPEGHFEVALSATDANDPTINCSGSGAFDIVPRRTSRASVNLYCRQDATTGSVAINGSVVRCPTIDSLSAEPSETTVGDTIALSVEAEDPDSLYRYLWTISDGTLADADTPHPELTCTSPGTVRLTLVVQGGGGLCSDTAEATVYCTPPDSDPQSQDDPSTPGDDRIGYLVCGAESCLPGSTCCAGDIGCAASPEACLAAGAPDYLGYRTCDGPEDCAPTEACAVSRHWVSCGPATFYGVLCHKDSDCVSTPDNPNPCQPNGYCDGPFE
ncbi:MAG: PKD domain-containing protein [Myxococcales bacterium]